MSKNLFFITLLWITLSCSEAKKPVYPLPKNAQELLTDGNKKTWKLAQRFNNDTRMNMAGCFLSYRLTFTNDMTLADNNGQQPDCGKSLKANWKFVKDTTGNYYLKMQSPQLPALMGIAEDFKLMSILALEEEKLVLQYYHRQFSNKPTKFTDYLVPENVSVKGRDFHW